MSDFEGGLRFWVLGLRSSFSTHPRKSVKNTDLSLKVQDAIISDVIIYPEMDISRTVKIQTTQLR